MLDETTKVEDNKEEVKQEVKKDTTSAPETEDMGFGISENLEASNKIPFKAGLQKGLLMGVKAYNKVSKKGEPFDVLEFNFVDLKGEANYDKVEFTIDRTKDIDKKGVRGNKEKAMNVRIKHIYEAYQPTPAAGLGFGAKNWLDYFERIAEAFNKNGKDGTPIYKGEHGYIPVHLKFTYFNNKLGFPYSPNFIEKIKEGKETNLAIDLNYDIVEQVKGTASTTKAPHEQDNTFGGASKSDYDEFMG